jgi:hypothetical protein
LHRSAACSVIADGEIELTDAGALDDQPARRTVRPFSSGIADADHHEALRAEVAEINARAPDFLWVALGAPYEQAFVDAFAPALANVGVIKTSGGLFNFPSGCSVPAWNGPGASGWSHAACSGAI